MYAVSGDLQVPLTLALGGKLAPITTQESLRGPDRLRVGLGLSQMFD